MLNYLYTAFLGLVQGIAEFLPISSSGHLSLFQNFFGLQSAEESNLFLDVVLHLGTLISVFIYYWHDIVSMVQEFFRGCAALVHRIRRRRSLRRPAAWCCWSLWAPSRCL